VAEDSAVCDAAGGGIAGKDSARSADAHGLPALAAETNARWITPRSFLVGTLGVCLVCALVPYNDYVVNNAFLVGSYLPVVVVLTFFILIVLVNGPLHRWAPARALRSGELAVIMLMMLAACSIPSQGLMRSLLPTLVVPFYFGSQEPRFWSAFRDLNLPGWLFPVEDISRGTESLVVHGFYMRMPEGEAFPYRAWVVPLAIWGIFFFALMSALVGLAMLLRHQWAVNERLPFPIARIESALIAPPRRGRMLNDLVGNRLFWGALAAVLFIHGTAALNQYFPRYVPEIPVRYDFTTLFSEPPWAYLVNQVKTARVYFTFVGIAYFIQGRVAFSLWSIFLITQLITVRQRAVQNDIPYAAWLDQHLGCAVAMMAGVLWVGRRHWWQVVRTAARGQSMPDGSNPRTPLLMTVAGIAVMLVWLKLAGVQWAVALGIVGVLLLAHLVIARVVAETGLPSVRAQTTLPQILTCFPPECFSGRDIFFTGCFTMNGAYTTRESVAVYAMHGEQVALGTTPPPRQRRWIPVLIGWSLVVGFVVCAYASLTCYYTYAHPLSTRKAMQLNVHCLETLPRYDIVNPLARHADGRREAKTHNPIVHFGIGLAVAGLLHAASLRWASWPFLPVGYLVSPTWLAQITWLSVFIGWGLKLLIVRFGGAKLYEHLRPVFVGMIFGEALALGAVLIVNLVLASMGYDYYVLQFLPT